ncbi:MAG TPA: DUF3106 domain-containing protein [Candidatus Acidoferrum sp.]|nr:DUF3106 domain-containing protein [Candidatus Acidoferrum sp.]
MRLRLQLAVCLLVLGFGTALAAPCLAQRGRANFAPQHPPPKAQARKQARQQQRQQEKQAQKESQANGGAGKPQGNAANGQEPAAHPSANPNGDPNRPPSSYKPPAPQRKFSDLSPQEKQRVLENNRKLQNMSPAQRQELNDRANAWAKLTPAQKDHIRNDVLPKWRQMPVERRQAIRQRLRVLQNMPESARNQRLNDPEFTKGMSEEDKATLRDLSHLHVGGAPDPPGE